LKTSGIQKLVADIKGYHGEAQTRLSIMLTLHCMVRTNETRFAHWSEFEDMEGEALWRIPAARMKMEREHLVPLSPQVLDILCELRTLNPKGYLFPGRKSGVQSQNSMIFGLYRMGYLGRLTTHGFRSMASTVLNESGFNRDWIEMQLAHVDGSVRGVYNSAEWLPGRRKMLCFWSDFLEGRVKLPAA
jgi:integrase